ncbi:CHAT domain-containing protein [Rhypophila decipiens]|uniref:CHAT domain-containing protein n=1 Tax=Rhypophila decipiens TaxID=261697 RepID=A0AAN6XZ49_9PEZI|nr:CHAT domain-containing protein [Rhypophila decipiens]
MDINKTPGGLLGQKRYEDYCQTSTAEYLNSAIADTEEATRLVPDSHPTYPVMLSNLSVYYHTRYGLRTKDQDLNNSIHFAQEAVRLTPEGDPDRPGRLSNLSNALELRYKVKGQMLDLEQAIVSSQEAVDKASMDDNDLHKMLNSLGNQLGQRYVEYNNPKDLDDAINALIHADDRTPAEETWHKAIILQNLGVRLSERFVRTGDWPDLDESIRKAEQALELCGGESKDFQCIASELGNRLGARYTRTREQRDLERAISLTKEALDGTPQDHADRPLILLDLSNRLRDKYQRTPDYETYLGPAISYCEESVSLTSERRDPQRARRLNSLANLLHLRYGLRDRREEGDLKTAIDLVREAIEITKEDHTHYAGWANDLSKLLDNNGPEHLDESIEWAERAVERTPRGHSERASWTTHLASLLLKRCGEDHICAKDLLVEALSDDACPIQDRIKAGQVLLKKVDVMFLKDGDQKSARQTTHDTIKLISLYAPRHLDSEDKQNILTDVLGLASEAAAVALTTGEEPLVAVQLLEEGRGVLLGSLYDLRTNVESLGQDYPDLASQFVGLREKLNEPGYSNVLDTLNADSPDRKSSVVLGGGRREIGKSMDELIQTIRQQPGYDQFLLPPSGSALLEASSGGPVVLLNISPLRCDALIIRPSGIHCLGLPSITYADIKDHSEPRKRNSNQTLGWLWKHIVCPVFDFLGFTTACQHEPWPRIWWVPTGALIKFPLHAAGHHRELGGATSLDRVISSYSPSVKSIIHSQQRKAEMLTSPAAPDDRTLVLIAMEYTPNQPHLKQAPKEIDIVRGLGVQMGLSSVSPTCQKQPVLASLHDCRILHFAGHGSSDPTQPLKSKLLLSDWESTPLTVQDLLDINLAQNPPFLAYLSSCGSGQVADDRSVDESIHLSSAFQLAGFRHVIGTLWEVNDNLCFDLAKGVYERLKSGGLTDESVSAALHHATRSLRDDWVRQLSIAASTTVDSRRGWKKRKASTSIEVTIEAYWIPYVHYGA